MTNYKHLGQLVHDERVRRYRTVDRARAVAQISRGAWDNVEKGKPAKMLTYNSIETALGWDLGYCQRVLRGEGDTVDDLVVQIEASDLSAETKAHILERLRPDEPDQSARKTS